MVVKKFSKIEKFYLSIKHPTFLKIVLLPIYFYYLSRFGHLSPLYILPIILTTAFKLETEAMLWIVLISAALDPLGNWNVIIEYGTYNVVKFIKILYGYEFAVAVSFVALGAFLGLGYVLVSVFSKLLQKFGFSILIVILVLIFFIHSCLYLIRLDPAEPSFGVATTVAMLGLFSKKFWILILAIQIKKFKYFGFLDFAKNIMFFGPKVREQFFIKAYYDPGLKTFLRGISLSFVCICVHTIINALPAEYDLVNDPICFGQVSVANYLSMKTSFFSHWSCWFRFVFLYGVIKQMFLDMLIMVIPCFLMGFGVTMPFGNIFTAKSYADFYNKLMTYYAYVIRVYFIWEFSLMFSKINLNPKVRKYLAIFFGVFLGGVLFHQIRDINYFIALGDKAYFNILNGPALYFLILAILISFNIKISNKFNFINLIFWIFITIIIRLITHYYQVEDVSDRIRLINEMLGF